MTHPLSWVARADSITAIVTALTVGQLNATYLYQGLASVGLHESRHLRQIEAIITSPGFPSIVTMQRFIR